MKHFLKLLDCTTEEIYELLDLAATMKQYVKEGKEHHFLKGKTLGMIFEKSSTRTRISFETGMYQLGGHALFISARDSQIGRGEPTQDTARVMSRMLDGIMIRTFEQKEVEMLAEYGSIPIINGLTDLCHPCQVMADLLTIREHKGKLEGLTMCYIGDGNNMANSLIVGGLKTGMNVQIACPEGYRPDPMVMDFAAQYPDKFSITDDPMTAAKDADVVITDCWTSMGPCTEGSSCKITGLRQTKKDKSSFRRFILFIMPDRRNHSFISGFNSCHFLWCAFMQSKVSSLRICSIRQASCNAVFSLTPISISRWEITQCFS